MFDYIKGTLTDKRKTARGTFFSVETSGTGYLLEVTENDFISHNVDENNIKKFLEMKKEYWDKNSFLQ